MREARAEAPCCQGFSPGAAPVALTLRTQADTVLDAHAGSPVRSGQSCTFVPRTWPRADAFRSQRRPHAAPYGSWLGSMRYIGNHPPPMLPTQVIGWRTESGIAAWVSVIPGRVFTKAGRRLLVRVLVDGSEFGLAQPFLLGRRFVQPEPEDEPQESDGAHDDEGSLPA
jgi:hypothetical protein